MVNMAILAGIRAAFMKTLRIAVLAYPGCMSTQLFGIADVLRIAVDIERRMRATRGVLIHVDLIGLPGRRITVSGNVALQLKRPASGYDLLVVPGMEIQQQNDWSEKLAQLGPEVDFIRRRFARGTPVAAVCIGAFLLGEAGLLDGRKATTAWLFADALARRYRHVKLEADAILVEDGGVITTAAVSSAFDLVIHLAKRHLGAEVAAATAGVTLLPSQRTSQSPYVDPRLLEGEMPTFSQNLAQWFELRLTEEYDLGKVAAAFHVSGRTLIRRVKSETGKSPLTILQEARVERAKQLLRTTRSSIAQIVEAVGYSDVASFTRLFARIVGETPARFRHR